MQLLDPFLSFVAQLHANGGCEGKAENERNATGHLLSAFQLRRQINRIPPWPDVLENSVDTRTEIWADLVAGKGKGQRVTLLQLLGLR